jgi:hypothetical protein
LEDFTRIWIDLSAFNLNINQGSLSLAARIESESGSPQVNLFKSVESDGGRLYLKNDTTGYNQIQLTYGQELCRVYGPTSVSLPPRTIFPLPADMVVHLLFEGVREGDGKLVIEVWKASEKLCDLPPVHLRLKKARDMYETWTVGDVEDAGVQWNVFPKTTYTQTTGQNLPAPVKPEEKDYIMLVHGWNMSPWEKEAFASTMFKRMWHQGYMGRFGAFRWPTFFGLGTDAPRDLHCAHFDGSEERAWNSAAPLHALTASLAETFKDSSGKSLVRLYAHSMGNVVASEALRQMAENSKVHTYISAQAALSSHVWDNTTPEMVFYTPSTPNVYGFYWQSGATSEPHHWQSEGRPSYMNSAYMPASTVYINHYNPLDWALVYARWQLNQSLKPDVLYRYGIMNPLDLSDLKKRFWKSPTRKLNFPNDRFEIFAYAAESRGYATGQQGATGGMFNTSKSVNLNDPMFQFGSAHKGHSAQFRSTIQKRWTYWGKALYDMTTQTP